MTTMEVGGTCKAGHALTEQNFRVYEYPNARHKLIKRCLTCECERQKKRRVEYADRVRETNRRANTKYMLRNPGLNRRRQLMKKYGLTEDAFAEMLSGQGGGCAVCELQLTLLPSLPNTAMVDHCHRTGVVRAILCRHCNSAIGYVKDSPSRARAIAMYLEQHAQLELTDPGDMSHPRPGHA